MILCIICYIETLNRILHIRNFIYFKTSVDSSLGLKFRLEYNDTYQIERRNYEILNARTKNIDIIKVQPSRDAHRNYFKKNARGGGQLHLIVINVEIFINAVLYSLEVMEETRARESNITKIVMEER